MRAKNDLSRLVEAAYATVRDDRAWLEGVLHAIRPFMDRGLGVVGVFYDLSDPEKPAMRAPIFVGAPNGASAAFDAMVEHAPAGLFASLLRKIPSCATLSDRLAAIGADIRAEPLSADVLAPLGVRDFLSVAATETSGLGCLVGAPLSEITSAASLDVDLWSAIAAHVTAGMRQRRRDRGDAKEADEAAMPVWSALVAGRWTVMDAFDRGAARFLVAKRDPNADAERPPPRAPLSPREQEVVARAAQGHSNKRIALDLGVAPSTVAGHLTNAAAKLGAKTRIELLTEMARLRSCEGDAERVEREPGAPGDRGAT